MMLRLVHFSVALFLCNPLANAEADTFKCTDGRRITYANVPCEEMDLKSAGPIKSLVTVLPAAQAATVPDKEGKPVELKTPQREADENNTVGGATIIKPVSAPLKETGLMPQRQ